MNVNMSPKKAALMMASMLLMLLSQFVDGSIAEEDTREIVREELEKCSSERH